MRPVLSLARKGKIVHTYRHVLYGTDRRIMTSLRNKTGKISTCPGRRRVNGSQEANEGFVANVDKLLGF